MGWELLDLMISGVDHFVDKTAEMTVFERVDDVAPVLAGGHQAGEAKLGQVLAD